MAFTPSQIWTFIIATIGLLLTILNIVDKFIQLHAKAKEPQDNLMKRVEDLEEWSKVVDNRLAEGSQHFSRIDDGNKVIQQALLALIDDALSDSGNHEELKRARKSLYEYLSEK